MKTLLTRLLPVFLFFHIFPYGYGQMVENGAGDKDLDQRVRERITPQKIIWQSDTSNTWIVDAETLLRKGSGQADLEGRNLCSLVGNGAAPPSIVLDFGRELHGGIEIVSGIFEGKSPIHVKIALGESVSEAMSKIESSTATNDHALREFSIGIPWLGKTHIGNSGFRFAKIELMDEDRTLKLKEINAISIYRPLPYEGSFRSSDSLLNEIWKVGAYTVHLNMQEYLWDGIKRDRLVWVGDMHPEVMTILSVFGGNEVVPKSLDMIRNITHLPDWMNGISSYSMWWILIHLEWYWQTGDLAYLDEHRAYLFALLEVLKTKIDEHGNEQLDGNRFLDWPTSPNKEAIDAGLQAMMVMTFRAGAEIASILGEESKRLDYLEVVDLLKQHVPDPNHNKSGAALLAISGLRTPEEINENYLSVDPTNGISTFYGYYVLQARALAGDYQGAMDVIRTYWGGMLALGATTFWEDFDLKWSKDAGRIDEITPEGKIDVHASYGDYCYVGLRHSLCHGWASGPTAWLSEHVLGIEVLEPGFRKVRISPHLGDLEWVEGTYPTPFGQITVKHSRTASGGIRSEIETPREIEVVDAE